MQQSSEQFQKFELTLNIEKNRTAIKN